MIKSARFSIQSLILRTFCLTSKQQAVGYFRFSDSQCVRTRESVILVFPGAHRGMKLLRSCLNSSYLSLARCDGARAMSSCANGMIDLRSDTITQPCAAMRQAMHDAPVGDDVLGDDPTVNYLEQYAAELLQKEKALFVPSATMGNLLSIASQCQRGDEIVLGDSSHIFLYEGANVCAYMGVGRYPVPTKDDGMLPLDKVEDAIRCDDQHYPRTSMIAIENTHNVKGGRVLSKQQLLQLKNIADDNKLVFHMDGARLANAAVALNTTLADLAAPMDSISLCLSKGLGAPVGAIVAGTEEMIYKARRARKSLGGGWRQAGVIAAGGLYALQNNIARLAEDHANAKALAHGLSKVPGVYGVNEDLVDTNIIFFEVEYDGMSWETYAAEMKKYGVLLDGGYGRRKKLRAVLNKHIDSNDIKTVVEAAEKVANSAVQSTA